RGLSGWRLGAGVRPTGGARNAVGVVEPLGEGAALTRPLVGRDLPGRSLLARPAPARRRSGVAAGPGRSRDAVADDGVLAQGGEQLAGEVAAEAGDASGAQAHPFRMGARGDDQVVCSVAGVEQGAQRLRLL